MRLGDTIHTFIRSRLHDIEYLKLEKFVLKKEIGMYLLLPNILGISSEVKEEEKKRRSW